VTSLFSFFFLFFSLFRSLFFFFLHSSVLCLISCSLCVASRRPHGRQLRLCRASQEAKPTSHSESTSQCASNATTYGFIFADVASMSRACSACPEGRRLLLTSRFARAGCVFTLSFRHDLTQQRRAKLRFFGLDKASLPSATTRSHCSYISSALKANKYRLWAVVFDFKQIAYFRNFQVWSTRLAVWIRLYLAMPLSLHEVSGRISSDTRIGMSTVE
jgi:hypothetical protein